MNEKLKLNCAGIESQIEHIKNEVNEILAEMELLKNRVEIEIRNAQKYSASEFASNLLPLKDALEKSLAVETSDMPALQKGIALSYKLIQAAFHKNGIKKISPRPGERFDPRKHHALCNVRIDWSPSYIVEVKKKGYEIEGRLLQRAMVVIAPDEPVA